MTIYSVSGSIDHTANATVDNMLDNVSCVSDTCMYGYGMGPGALFWLFLDGVLFVVIVCGNIVTIYVLRTSLQFSPLVSNQFVLSLALSDMLVGLTLPYHMAFYVAPYLATMKHTCILK